MRRIATQDSVFLPHSLLKALDGHGIWDIVILKVMVIKYKKITYEVIKIMLRMMYGARKYQEKLYTECD